MSKNDLPLSILFCCDHNAIRSPIAEGLMKKKFGTLIYVQSVGVESEREIDVELSRHQVRNFDEMEALGDHMEEFDIVVALSRASHIKVMKLVNNKNSKIEYWPIIDPIFNSERREEKLIVYRAIRDQLDTLIFDRFNEK